MTTDIEVNGQRYRVGKLDAMKQFHVSRRLGPLLATMGISLSVLGKGAEEFDLNEFLPLLEPITKMMAEMSDEDADYIIFTCLSVVTRLQGGRPAPVSSGRQLMFHDIEMPTLLRLTVEVLKGNLANFLKEPSAVTNSLGS